MTTSRTRRLTDAGLLLFEVHQEVATTLERLSREGESLEKIVSELQRLRTIIDESMEVYDAAQTIQATIR